MSVRFLLNQTEITLEKERADLTVLEFLRLEAGLAGTKEGCASGDCGACTVVTARIDPQLPGQLRYETVNSCITFIGALHGRQLLTIEHLQHNTKLHQVQDALVTHHGSQCGFCTPGVVMSMFGLYKHCQLQGDQISTESEKRSLVQHHLGGNLCRCTGYRPITDACLDVIDNLGPDQFDNNVAATRQKLQIILDDTTAVELSGDDTSYYAPTSLSSLFALYDENTSLLAGGTDLALEVTQKLKSLNKLISVAAVEELQQFELTEDSCVIGAAVTLRECMEHLSELFPALAELLLRFGSTQIRNQGTVGGSLANASPIGDLAPVFIALDARLQLASASGDRTVSINQFFIDYRETALGAGEIIKAVRLDNLSRFRSPAGDTRLLIYKISKRFDDDISALCAAFVTTVEKDRLTFFNCGFGGMAATPARAEHCVRVMQGQPLTTDVLIKAKQALESDFAPISDVRASAGYRQQVAQNLLERLRVELQTPDQPQQVAYYEHDN